MNKDALSVKTEKKMISTDHSENNQKLPDKHFPTAMDIYAYLWKGRDFELDHLWQRSVFLGAFLLAVAALYIGYMKEFFIPKYIQETQTEYCGSGAFSLHTDIPVTAANCGIPPEYYPVEMSGTYTTSTTPTQNKKDQTDTLVLHDTTLFGLIPVAITLLGLAFSVLWITMAKGSKAWYELYESNIAAISGNEAFWEGDDHKNQELTNRFGKKQDDYKTYLFGNLENRAEPDGDPIDSKLFSVDAGPFSVSKINTMIGIISLTAFLCTFAFHVYWAVKLLHEHSTFFTLVCFTAEVITALFIIFRLKNKVRSSYFDNL